MAQHFHQDEYAAKKENTVIVLMSALIILSLVGAYSLYRAATPDCLRADYIYCGDPVEHPHRFTR